MSAERRRWSAIVATVTVLSGCTSVGPTGIDTAGPEQSAAAPAVVVRGDIVSVLTVDAVVTATPRFVVRARVDGQVYHIKLEAGAEVAAGQTVLFQDGQELPTPVDSFFVEWLVPDRVSVHAGVPVASLRYVGFGIAADVPPEVVYRLYDGPSSARAQITGGPGPTDCDILPVAPAGDALPAPDAGADSAAVPVLCAVPEGVLAYAGSPAVLGLTTGERKDVLLLPVQAVAGTAGQGTVAKLVDGAVVVTEVTLGITDGVNIEVVDGLAEGDMVLPYGPNLRPPVVVG